MEPTPRPLVVVTQREWVYREMAEATHGQAPVHRAYGLDVPQVPHRSSWWMPPQFAARLHRANDCPPLTAPGPRWLSTLSRTHPHLTGREVRTLTVSDLTGLPGPGWVKPAQAKTDRFPAAWRTPEQAAAAAAEARFPADALVQWSPTDLPIDIEVRAYVTHGVVTTVSTYRLVSRTYDALIDSPAAMRYARDPWLLGTAVRYAQDVVDALDGRYPAGWVLDVAHVRGGGWVVLEGNAAWASGWYDADLHRVRACIDAACPDLATRHGAREHRAWGWEPDPFEVAAAAALAPLRQAGMALTA